MHWPTAAESWALHPKGTVEIFLSPSLGYFIMGNSSSLESDNAGADLASGSKMVTDTANSRRALDTPIQCWAIVQARTRAPSSYNKTAQVLRVRQRL